MAASGRQTARPPHQRPPAVKPALWDEEFGPDLWEAEDRRAALVTELAAYLASPAGWQQLTQASGSWHDKVIVELDWQALVDGSGSADLPHAMHAESATALRCLSCAAFETLFRLRERDTRAELPGIEKPGRVLVRLVNHPTGHRLCSAVKADAIHRLVSVRGTVVRATTPAPVVTDMEFVCGKCAATQAVPFPDGRFAAPQRCVEMGCRSRTFAPNRTACTCIDWQRVSLQGLPKDERGSVGRVPVPVAVELREDLVGCCSPGDVITVVGVVKVMNGDPGAAVGKKGGGAKQQCVFLPYIDALSVVVAGREAQRPHLRQAQRAAEAAEAGALGAPEGEQLSFLPPSMPCFSATDLAFVVKFASDCEGDMLRWLVLSLCPTIYGQELVKAGLVLALLGGTRKVPTGEGDMPLRGDVHVLIVGDPGLGKSQLLQAAAAAAPRGVYICGTGSSAAGLTVSVVRENGEFAFDAGALVLADRGVCCIDEFDKMTSEHQALLGAMEQQEVNVAKAGMVASLPARTTVLAAANPVEGSYNRGRTLQENLKISPAMLSRFDLTFLLLDRPDAERDARLTEHVMALHSGVASRAAAARSGMLTYSSDGGRSGGPLLLTDGRSSGPGGGEQGHPPLVERLRVRKPGDDPVPPALLRKYIAYARQYVHPRLTAEAVAVLKEYYLQLRAASLADPGGLPITARQLESLVRLSEARARAELREEVTREDAEDVVELMKQTIDSQVANAGGDLGMLDFTARDGGRAGSKAAESRRLREGLVRHCQNKGDNVVEMWEIQDVADRIVLQVPSLQKLVDQLNEAGDLLKKGGSRYQVSGVQLPAGSGGGAAPAHSGAVSRGGYGGGYGGDCGSGGYAGVPSASQQSAGSKRTYLQHEQQQNMPPPQPQLQPRQQCMAPPPPQHHQQYMAPPLQYQQPLYQQQQSQQSMPPPPPMW